MSSLTGQKRGIEVHAPAGVVCPGSTDPAAWNAYFESLYQDAAGDVSRIPWGDERACPALVAWLNREAASVIRPGASVMVVGCGLGDDVNELAARGYDAIAFDVSPTAVQWARKRHPSLAERFMVADLLNPPTGLLRRADLVVEINTVQSVHPSLRERAVAAIAALARPRGAVLVICRGRAEAEPLPEHPPFPLSPAEVTTLFGAHGMTATRSIDDFVDDEVPAKRRLRATFRRG